MVSWVRDTVQGYYQDRFIHQVCIRTLWGQSQNTLHWTKGGGDFRVIFAEGKFDRSELCKGNISKQKGKWHLVLNVSKSKSMEDILKRVVL